MRLPIYMTSRSGVGGGGWPENVIRRLLEVHVLVTLERVVMQEYVFWLLHGHLNVDGQTIYDMKQNVFSNEIQGGLGPGVMLP